MPKTPQLSARDITGVVAYLPTTVRTDIVIDRNTKDAVDLEEAVAQHADPDGEGDGHRRHAF